MRRQTIWRGLASAGSLVMILSLFGSSLAFNYTGAINSALGVQTSKMVDEGDSGDTTYYKSEFGEFNEENQARLIEATFEQNIAEMEEGAVLLRNRDGALPLASNERKVTLFGHASYDPAYKSSSAGSRPNFGTKYAVDLRQALLDDGFEINETLFDAYSKSSVSRGQVMDFGLGFPVRVMDGSAVNQEEDSAFYTPELQATYANYNDVAIVVFAREASEGTDMNMVDTDGRSSLALHQNEEDLLAMVRDAGFGKIIVLLNSPYQMELEWLDEYNVDACLLIGAVGSQGFRGVSSILTGETNPSGHLVDTYAANSLSSPACVNSGTQTPQYLNADAIAAEIGADENASAINFQAEGIYIGYKYYETRYEDSVLGQGNADGANGASDGAQEWRYEDEITFPFGYGLSYTSFEQTLGDVTYDADEDLYHVQVTVENTGDVAGKSVVQVYVQTPYGEYEQENKVEKSAVQLAGFGKTQLLQPGESEQVDVTVDRYLLASYDYTNAKGYILSEGNYYFAIGDDAHDALNNILAAKDATGMVDPDGNAVSGDASKTWEWTQDQLDADSYRLSSAGVEVTNQFDDCDLNYWIEGAGTYLSRSDWNGTYPVAQTTVEATEEMIAQLSGDTYVKPEDAPTVAEATKDLGTDKGITLVEMRDVAWDDEDAWNEYLNQMTLEELASTLSCSSGRKAVESVVLPQTTVGDGVDGCMGKYPYPYDGIENFSTTCYANKGTLTATWNKDLYQRRGELMGEEALWCGQMEVWCIGADLHRTPFGGRNYEYMSECSIMSYLASIPEVKGMESKGVLAGVKHFTGNDQEYERHGVSTFFNEQAFREGSLRGFEGALRVAGATSLMQSFNRLGCEWASSKSALNKAVCLGEWGFQGHLETDGTDSAASGYMSHYATSLAAGSDTYCLNEGIATESILQQIADTDDGYLVQCVKEQAKHFHYAASHSCAINGISETAHVVQVTPWWQTAIYVVDAVLIILEILWLVLLVRSRREPSIIIVNKEGN